MANAENDRPRRMLFIMDPVAQINPELDTTFVLIQATHRLGHRAYYTELKDLYAVGPTAYAAARRIQVARETPHFQLFEERSEPLDWFDAVFMRKDPPFDAEYLHATHLMSLVDPEQTLMVNDPRALRDANEKLYALQFPDVIPSTLVSADMQRLRAFIEELGGNMIIKPLDGAGGAGIFHLRSDDRNVNALLEASTDEGKRMIIAQQYLPEARNGDKRVILLNGVPLGAVLRIPRSNDTRGNIHVGGRVERTEITLSDRRIIDRIAPTLQANGLHFVGIDIIGEYLTEINVTSPTGVQEINRFDNETLETAVISYAVTRCRTL